MNTYMIVGEHGLKATPKQPINAESARDAVERFRASFPELRIVKVWLLQEITKEFWSGDAPSPEAPRPPKAWSHVVEIPAMVFGNRPTPALVKARSERWATAYANSNGFTECYPVFTDGRVTHYEFD